MRKPKNGDTESQQNGNREKRTRFKTWLIPLPNFRYHHEPYRGGMDYRDFMGRDELLRSFVDMLHNSRSKSGSYLVTGYRGSGKTSFLKKVLEDYSTNRHALREIKHYLLGIPLVSPIYYSVRMDWLGRLDLKRRIHVARLYYRIRKDRPGQGAPSDAPPASNRGSGIRWFESLRILSRLVPKSGNRLSVSAWICFSVVLFFVVLPEGWIILLLAVLFLSRSAQKHQSIALACAYLLKRSFRPVVPVHINLGYEIRDPKKVLFGIISLLRSRYTDTFSLRSLPGTIQFLFAGVIALSFAHGAYLTISGHGTEQYIQTSWLGVSKEIKPEDLMKDFCNHPDKVNAQAPSAQANDHSSHYIWPRRGYCSTAHFIQGLFQSLKDERSNLENKHTLLSHFKLDDNFKRTTIFLINELTPITGRTEKDRSPEISIPRPFQLIYYLALLAIGFSTTRWMINLLGPARVIRKLDALHTRIVSTDKLETGIKPASLLYRGRQRQYHPMDAREAESQLLALLEINLTLFSLLPRPDIIFLFDELDKINPEKEGDQASHTRALELGLSETVRARKHEVEALLGNLKNLITMAPCRFIFIAGREMMDAHLADQAQTRYLYGSLFDAVFYIPSFLSDGSDQNHRDITSMVEQYVCRRLIPRRTALHLYYRHLKDNQPDLPKSVFQARMENDYSPWSLMIYGQYLNKLKCNKKQRPEIDALIIFLQDFILFLAYRSGGNPKKLALLFEEFIATVPNETLLLPRDRKPRRWNNLYHKIPYISPMDRSTLSFRYHDQYRIQLISHLFILFKGHQGHLIRQYGDKLSVSVFSILDYIFKFHSSGFSYRELERMPDVLDIHRAPALPQILEMLLSRLLRPYLRKSVNGLYDFKFLSYFRHEVLYISQFSEDALAAFNFSLDEAIQIKRHYRQLLEEEIRQHDQVQKGFSEERESGTPHSLPYLHTILGDLHFLDKEHDQARIEYRNAVQYLEPSIKHLEIHAQQGVTPYQSGTPPGNEDPVRDHPVQEDVNQIVLYVRLLLKLGLLEEQRGLYDGAVAVYYQACRAIDHVLEGEFSIYFIGPHIERLVLLLQPYICLPYVHAKRDLNGETAHRLMQRSMEKIVGVLADSCRNRGRSNTAPDDLELYRKAVQWTRGAKVNLPLMSALSGDPRNPEKDDNGTNGASGTRNGNGNVCLARSTGRFYPPPITRESSNHLLILGRFQVRWAEMSLFRSEFPRAIALYLDGVRSRSLCNGYQRARKPDWLVAPRDQRVMEALGRSLLGLADTSSGYALHECYRRIVDGQSPSEFLPELPKHQGNPVNLDQAATADFLGKAIHAINKLKLPNPGDPDVPFPAATRNHIRRDPLKYYLLAFHVFRLCDRPAEAALTLWQLSYMLSVGLSYLDFCPPDENGPDEHRLKPNSPTDIEWLFGPPDSSLDKVMGGAIQILSDRAFGGSYKGHVTRLEDLIDRADPDDPNGSNDTSNLLHWMVEPLSQTAAVLALFWNAYWHPGGKMDGDVFRIRDMGTFPLGARLLAQYLKGRWYIHRGREMARTNDYAASAISDMFVCAFRLLRHCVDDGRSYQAGGDIISPPHAFVYYHLWWLTRYRAEDLDDSLAKEPDFGGDQKILVDEAHYRLRAQEELENLVGRHRGGDAFFNYARDHFYLQEDFSDSSFNVTWSVEYGLVPVAEAMLNILREATKKA